MHRLDRAENQVAALPVNVVPISSSLALSSALGRPLMRLWSSLRYAAADVSVFSQTMPENRRAARTVWVAAVIVMVMWKWR